MATKKGDDKDNVLTGTAGDDIIFGYGGNDTIRGGKGIDNLTGGAGADTFVFAPQDVGQDTITDFGGGDKIDLSAFGISSFAVLKDYYLKPDRFGTGLGFRFNGQAASVFLDGIDPALLKASDFILSTTKKAQAVKGSSGDDDLFGGTGNDTINAGAGSDRLSGGEGKDVFVFEKRVFGNDAILDFAKGDKIDLSGLGVSDFDQVRYLLKVNGADQLPGFSITSIFNGVEERIEVHTIGFREPAAADFVFNAAKAADKARVQENINVLFGGRGNSTLTGGNYSDTLLGGAGDDVLDGGGFNDMLMLGSGRDRAVFSERFFGNDTILDFEEGDKIDLKGVGVGDFATIAPFFTWSNEGGALLQLTPYGGGATIFFDGVKVSALDAGDFVFDESTKSRRVEGGERDDFLIGGRGDDRIVAGTGYDIVTAGAGKDTIIGGATGDLLYGGGGPDSFIFTAVGDSAPTSIGADKIGDFSRKDGDRIDLSAVDADETTGKDDGFVFIGTKAFSGAAGEVRYEVQDGSAHVHVCTVAGGQPYQMEVVLSGVTDLRATDFVL